MLSKLLASCLVVLSGSLLVQSRACADWTLSPVVPELRFEKGSDKLTDRNVGWGMALRYDQNLWGLEAEVVRSSALTGNESLNVKSSREEVRFQGLWSLHRQDVYRRSVWDVSMLGGLGAAQDDVTTVVLGAEDRVKSSWKGLWIAGLNSSLKAAVSPRQIWVLSFESRVLGVPSQSSDLAYLLGMKIGVQF